jgi:hypothetical protein
MTMMDGMDLLLRRLPVDARVEPQQIDVTIDLREAVVSLAVAISDLPLPDEHRAAMLAAPTSLDLTARVPIPVLAALASAGAGAADGRHDPAVCANVAAGTTFLVAAEVYVRALAQTAAVHLCRATSMEEAREVVGHSRSKIEWH